MRILVNATTIVKGGGVQVAAEFCNQLVNVNGQEIQWHLLFSNEVQKAIDDRRIDIPYAKCVIPKSPARCVTSRRQIRAIESEIQPDCVFTVFGPAYVKFRSPHVCGVADPWVTHADRLAYAILPNVKTKVANYLLSKYKANWFKMAQRWIVEAPVAKAGLVKRNGVRAADVFVITNCCGQHYLNSNAEAPQISHNTKIRVLTLSAYYPHKNLEIIPHVAHAIRQIRRDLNLEFVITLPADSRPAQRIAELAKRLGVGDSLVNIGPVDLSNGPRLYKSCSICFLPSVLESFSANYAEAMALQRPIVTTDLEFARNICADAAIYFQPTCAQDAAVKVLSLVDNPNLVTQLVTRGRNRLHEFDSPRTRLDKTLRVLMDTVGMQSTSTKARCLSTPG